MAEARLLVPHAILFVLDLENQAAEIPAYAPGKPVSANEGCVSVCTQADVDGEVTVRLAAILPASERMRCTEVFRGRVQAPSRRVAVATSSLEAVLDVAVPGPLADVAVWIDDPRAATLVCVEAR